MSGTTHISIKVTVQHDQQENPISAGMGEILGLLNQLDPIFRRRQGSEKSTSWTTSWDKDGVKLMVQIYPSENPNHGESTEPTK